MQGQLTVVGAKQFNDTVEGVKYNHTKLLVLLPFPRSRIESNCGNDVAQAPFGTFENYAQFKNAKYPLVIDAEYEVTTRGIEIFAAKIISAQKL